MIVRKPPMGWNSWNTFAENINEKLIFETADRMVADGYLVATTAQNPYNMGYYGIKTAVEYLTNGTTEFEDVDTGATMLTADYIAENGLLG